MILDQVGPKTWESWVAGQPHQIEGDGRPPLGQPEEMEESPRVLAARHADQDPVSGLDQAEVPDRLAEAGHESPLEPLVFAHAGRLPRRWNARIVAPPWGHFNRPACRLRRREHRSDAGLSPT